MILMFKILANILKIRLFGNFSGNLEIFGSSFNLCASINISQLSLPNSALYNSSEASLIAVSPGLTFLILVKPVFFNALLKVSKL